ncbi:MAG: hypothetical protein MZU84_04200 [Sphingobacterium sp.]|nr:hypothetical protein [Sphingobacterium sp.]
MIGYLHRGIEKLSENRDYTQIVLLTDRMDYVAAATNNLGYVETVEKLHAARGAPPRAATSARCCRSCSASPATCCGSARTRCDLGALTVLLFGLRERELVLDLFEEYCGARLTYNSMRIGGQPVDVPPGWDKKVLAVLRRAGAEAARVRDSCSRSNRILHGAHEGHRRHLGGRRRSPSGCAARRCAPRACCATSARTSPTRPTTRWSSTCRSA